MLGKEDALQELKFIVGTKLRGTGAFVSGSVSPRDAANDVLRTALEDPRCRELLLYLLTPSDPGP